MDGLWSSPDLAGAAPSGRRSTATRSRCRPAGSACRPSSRRTFAHRRRRNTKRLQPAEHRGALRPGERLLPAVPRRDVDLLERRLRVAGPVARRRPAEQVPASSPRNAGPGAAASTSSRSGRAGAASPCTRPASSAAGSRRSRSRASSTTWPAQRVRAAGLDHLVDVQLRDYRDITGTYDAIVSIEMLEAVGAEYFDTFFEVCDRALAPGRPAQPPVDHLPGCRVRATAARRELDPDVHLPGRAVPVAGGHRAVDPRHAAADPAASRDIAAATS